MLLLVAGRCPSALAHSVHVDAFAEEAGRAVTIEAYFGDGKPVAHAMVRVRNQAGQEVLTGTTDAEGRYLYQPQTAEPVTVEVIQAAHRGTVSLGADVLAQVSATGAGAPTQTQPAPASPAPAQKPVASANDTRSRAGRTGKAVPALAGIALILSVAALWQSRSLTRRISKLEEANRQKDRPTVGQ